MAEAYHTRIPIRLDDVDYARVLYYPRQVHLFVVALEDFFRDALKLPWAQVMFAQENLCMPTVNINVSYQRPLRFGQVADIAIRVRRIGHTSVKFAYVVTEASGGEATCTAEQTVVFVDNDTWAPVRVPDNYRRALAPYVAAPDEA